MERETKLDIIELTRAYLGVLLLAILMYIGIVSAFEWQPDDKIYAGDKIAIQNKLTTSNLVYTIIGNSSPIPNLNMTINTTNITIKFPDDMPINKTTLLNSFTIVFLEKQVEKIPSSSSGSRGSRTKYIDRNITVEIPKIINKTTEIYVNNCTNETISIPEEVPKPKRNFIVRFFKWIWSIFT